VIAVVDVVLDDGAPGCIQFAGNERQRLRFVQTRHGLPGIAKPARSSNPNLVTLGP